MKNFIVIVIAVVIGFFIGNAQEEQVMPPMVQDSMSMESMMMDMTERMQGKTGDELDKIFLEDMIVHHQGAVDMAIILRDKTGREELKSFAQEIISVQDQEINMMKGWLSEWFTNE